MALTDLLSAIGDAIREMTGTTEKLTLAEMPNKIRKIDNLVNYVAGKPTKIESDEITSLPQYIFQGAKNLVELNLPNLKTVGMFSLVETGLTTLNLPKLQTMHSDSMNNNRNLKSINLPNLVCEAGYKKGFCVANCSYLTDVNIPKVMYIDSNGFNYCTNLKRLDLPSVIKIDNVSYLHPFANCYKLETLILRANQVVELADSTAVFTSCPINNGGYNGIQGYIYVPKALLEDYKVATNWSVYADRFRAIEDYPDICGEVAQ